MNWVNVQIGQQEAEKRSDNIYPNGIIDWHGIGI